MSIEAINFDGATNALNLEQWLQNDEVSKFQRNLEERVLQFLFNHDPDDPQFLKLIEQLAWIGTNPSVRPLLEREIIELHFSNEREIIQCDLWKK